MRLAALTLIAGLLGACASRPTGPQPPEIFYGQEVCEACGMIIDDARFAAAFLDADGQAHKFDDVGEMIGYQMNHPDLQVQVWFVHDYPTQTWIRGETAFYVMSESIGSPMAHGIAAFASAEEARQFADERNVEVLTFDDLRVAVHLQGH